MKVMIICISITIYLMVVILGDTYDTFNIFCVYNTSEILITYEINAVITRCFNLRCRQKLAHLEYQVWDPCFQSLLFLVALKCWGLNPTSHLAGRESASEPHLQPVIWGLNYTACPYIRGKKMVETRATASRQLW